MTDKELTIERYKLDLARAKLDLIYARRDREDQGAELRARFDRDIAALSKAVEEKELTVQREELYLRHALAEQERGFGT